MKIAITGSIVTLEKSNPKERYATESALFYALRNALKHQGLDAIKRNPAKDGHLTSAPYYIRERKGEWAMHDHQYAVRSIKDGFNNHGYATLGLVGLASDTLRRCFGVSAELAGRAKEARPSYLDKFKKWPRDPGWGGNRSRGAGMGRANCTPKGIPADYAPKFLLRKSKWSGDYDEGGAYFGNTGKDDIYWAVDPACGNGKDFLERFIRATSRADAKAQIRKEFPAAKFFR